MELSKNLELFAGELINTTIEAPFLTLLAIVAFTCTVTRVVTEIQFRAATSKQLKSSQTARTAPVVPYWTPWLGHVVPFAFKGTDYLERWSRSLGPQSSIFKVSTVGYKVNIITRPSLAKQIMFGRNIPVNMDALVFHALKTIWNDKGTTQAIDPSDLWGPIHSGIYGLSKVDFVTPALEILVNDIEERIWNLVSGSRSPIDQSPWERSARVEAVPRKDPDPFVVEVNLNTLLRDFVGDVATASLFGRNFMENNPDILGDIWKVDVAINMFLTGIPDWFPGMIEPSRARNRVIRAVMEHHEALAKYLAGDDPGIRWSDMSDVSIVMKNRTKAYQEARGTSAWAAGCGDSTILWAMNANANQMIFWVIWYTFSDENLLREVREEIAPYVKVRGDDFADHGRQLRMDFGSLFSKCPLIKGVFFEALRLETWSSTVKYVENDFILTETEEDAIMLGKPSPDSFILSKGEAIFIPHVVHQYDEQYFPNPKSFEPRRFWNQSDSKVDIYKLKPTDTAYADIKVDYKTMKVWGGGKTMCKGKAFAEREVLAFAAAVIMQWDMEPVSNGGKWIHPGRRVATATTSPAKNVRVRLSRREAW